MFVLFYFDILSFIWIFPSALTLSSKSIWVMKLSFGQNRWEHTALFLILGLYLRVSFIFYYSMLLWSIAYMFFQSNMYILITYPINLLYFSCMSDFRNYLMGKVLYLYYSCVDGHTFDLTLDYNLMPPSLAFNAV